MSNILERYFKIKPKKDATGSVGLPTHRFYEGHFVNLYVGYVLDPTVPDHGVVTSRGSRSLKDFIDTIGTSRLATILVPHSTSANTDTYTLTTSETVPSNITLVFQPGAIFDGAGTLTLAFWEQIRAGLCQTFGSSVTVTASYGGLAEASWWGLTRDMSTNNDSVIDAALSDIGNTAGAILRIPNGVVWDYANITNHGTDVIIQDDSGYDFQSGTPYFGSLRKVICEHSAAKNAGTFYQMSNHHPAFVVDNYGESDETEPAPQSSFIHRIDGVSKIQKVQSVYGTSIRSGTYEWTESGSGSDEYFLEISGGGDPNLGYSGTDEPSFVLENNVAMTPGTVGSLALGEWDWADSSGEAGGGTGGKTIYVRLSSGAANVDPDSCAAGYVEIGRIIYQLKTHVPSTAWNVYSALAEANRVIAFGAVPQISTPFYFYNDSLDMRAHFQTNQNESELLMDSYATGNGFRIKQEHSQLTDLSSSATWSSAIPAGSMVIGVAARVTTLITANGGGVTWDLGEGGDADRWGTGLAFAKDTTVDLADAVVTAPAIFTSATDIVLAPDAGAFTAGAVRLTVTYIELIPPTS